MQLRRGMQQQQRVPAVYWYFSAIFLLFLGYYYKSKAVSLRSVLLAFSTAFFSVLLHQHRGSCEPHGPAVTGSLEPNPPSVRCTLSASRRCCSTLVVTARRFLLPASHCPPSAAFRYCPTLAVPVRHSPTCSVRVTACFTVHCSLHKNAACACWSSHVVLPACILSTLISTQACRVRCSLATASFHCNDPGVSMHTILGPPLCSIYLVNPHDM
jgi:hypothetical protein